MIIVYSKPNCMACNFTKKHLVGLEKEFIEKDVEASEEALDEIKAMGFSSLPVIVADGYDPFTGFQPEKLEEI